MRQDSKGQELKQGYTVKILMGERVKYYTLHDYKGSLMFGRINARGAIQRIPLDDIKSENIIILNT